MNSKVNFKDFLQLRDSQELYFWGARARNPKGVLIIVHGLGEHSGRYEDFVSFLHKRHWDVYLYDQRGHGKTPGIRSYVESFSVLVGDLHEFVQYVTRQESGTKPFLMGHSFGGQVAINYLAKFPNEVRGAILSSPNIKLAMEVHWIKRFIGKWVSSILPSLSISSDLDPKWISHNPKVVRDYKNDRLVQNKITLRLGNEMLANLEEIPTLAKKIKTPVYLFHGSEDKITCSSASEEFFENIHTKDRQLKIYPGLYHETLNENGKEEVYQDVMDWLGERSA